MLRLLTLLLLAHAAMALCFSPAAICFAPTAGCRCHSSPDIVMRANADARRAASTRAKNKNGHRRTVKVNEFGLEISTDKTKAQKSKIDVLLLKPVNGLGDAGDRVAVSVPQFENSLRRSGSARLLKPHELQ